MKKTWKKFTEEFPELDYWLRCRQAERGVNRTLTEYRMEVEHFATWLGTRQLVLDASRRDVREYLYYIAEERKASAATQARSLAALKSFYEFLVGEEMLRKNPCAGIPKPSLPFRLPTVLTRSQVDKTLLVQRDRPETEQGRVLTLRDKAIIEVLYSTGLRRTELQNLKKTDITWSQRKIRVIGKGNKERTVFFNDDAANALAAWLSVRPPSTDEAVFVTTTGTRLSSRQIWWVVKSELQAAGLPGATHTMRHSYATHLYQQGMDLLMIQKLLGHTSANTTEKYVHLATDDLKRKYDSIHEKE